ncbi:MAG: YgcG family protein [Treponema sp.]|nr:YgcG family protein [Treponema sp.]
MVLTNSAVAGRMPQSCQRAVWGAERHMVFARRRGVSQHVWKKTITILAAILCASSAIFALSVPALTDYVIDNANIISSAEKQELVSYLASLENTTGIQIAVLTIPSLEGESLEQFSMRVVEQWQLGQAKEDNGALLLIALNERKIRIEVGYGLEGKLTDTKCGLIIRNVIAPKFQSGNYGEGIIAGVKNMGGIAASDAQLVEKSVVDEREAAPIPAILFALLFYLAWITIIPNLACRRSFWIPWYLFAKYRQSTQNRTGRYSSGRSYSSRGSFGGGFSSGGFSGGGGGFGGGGASGGW